jgi:dTDP-4-dehydrorhamnose reductase
LNKKKSILVVGMGFLGKNIVQIGKESEYEINGTHLNSINNSITLDVRNIKNIESVFNKINPDYVINCAVNGQIDYLEKHKELAMEINAEGALNVAKICKENKTKMIFVSTDSVFDGKKGNYNEKDEPNPLNIYAESKLKGEKYVSKTLSEHVIARTNFYGLDENSTYFLNWVLKSLKNKQKMIGFEDVIFSPLDITTLSKMLIELLEKKYSGVIHLSSGTPITKYDFILKIVKKLGYTKNCVSKGKLSDINLEAKRPKNTSLNNSKANEILEIPPLDLSKWLEQNKEKIFKFFN